MSIERAMEFWLVAEGGDKLHKNAGDPGGWTRYGIAQRYHSEVDLATLDWPHAQRILSDDYWVPNRCDVIERFAPLTAWALFDFCGNGSARAARGLFQKCVGAAQDGAIGLNTLRKARGYVRRHDDAWLAHRLCEQRIRRQIRLADTAAQRRFLGGLVVRFLRLDVEIQRAQST